MARVRWPNQVSRPRENVTVAPVASVSAGSSAMNENSATTRRMQPGAGDLLLPGRPQALDLHPDDRDHGADQDQVDRDHEGDDRRSRGTIGVRPVMIR